MNNASFDHFDIYSSDDKDHSAMTETELDVASPGLQRENKSRKKSLTNAEFTIEVS